jgi:hypothetical protein
VACWQLDDTRELARLRFRPVEQLPAISSSQNSASFLILQMSERLHAATYQSLIGRIGVSRRYG